MQHSEARRLRRVLTIQAALGAVIVGAAALAGGAAPGISAAAGAGASLAGNLVAARWIHHDYRAQDPERITMRLYLGEAVKIAVVLAIFAFVFATFDEVAVAILLGSFLVTQVAASIIAALWDSPPGRGPGARKHK